MEGTPLKGTLLGFRLATAPEILSRSRCQSMIARRTVATSTGLEWVGMKKIAWAHYKIEQQILGIRAWVNSLSSYSYTTTSGGVIITYSTRQWFRCMNWSVRLTRMFLVVLRFWSRRRPKRIMGRDFYKCVRCDKATKRCGARKRWYMSYVVAITYLLASRTWGTLIVMMILNEQWRVKQSKYCYSYQSVCSILNIFNLILCFPSTTPSPVSALSMTMMSFETEKGQCDSECISHQSTPTTYNFE